MRFGPGTFLLASLLTFASGPVLAQTGQPIGSTVVVVNLVTAELANEGRELQIGDNVRQDEVIEVGADGRGELKLNDETKLALGPGSRLLLDKFVYDSQKTSGTIVLNLVKGAFRFITGIASKPSYLIRVPNASITVRGTIFDVFIQPNNVVWLLLHEGSVQVCNDRGQCRVLDQPGRLIRISDGGAVGEPSRWASLPGRQNIAFDNAFPFVVAAPQFDPDPIFTRDAILLGRFIPHRPRHHSDPPYKKAEPKYTGTKVTRLRHGPTRARVVTKTFSKPVHISRSRRR
jgi:hypothetical protein